MRQALQDEINETFDQLAEVFSAFGSDQIDIVPFEGSWTAGQVGEHVMRSLSNIQAFLNGDTSATSRPYDEKSAILRNAFLDFNSKMQSPDFILPRETIHSKERLLKSFDDARQQMLQIAGTSDLTVTCNSFEMPGLGFLTRMEWLTFYIVHTRRHVHQLNNIRRALEAKGLALEKK